MNFQPRYRHRYIHFASPHNPKKDKNKKQPELLENQTAWKSDNQKIKEETFIQSRGGVVQAVRVERTHSKAAAEGPGKVRQ